MCLFIYREASRPARLDCYKAVRIFALFTLGLSFSLQAESVLLRNVSIISGDNPQPSTPQHVLLRDGKIQAIGADLLPADRQIDGSGKFLLPGLIDSHVHLDGVPGYKGNSPSDQPMLAQARQQIPRSYLYFGFTTVLDLTGDANFIADWNRQAAAPNAYFCAPVVIPNGYPAVWLGKEAQFKVAGSQYMLYDPAQPDVYPASFIPAEHSPQAVVALAKKQGASCIKVFYETGFGAMRDLPVPSVALISEVVQQARQQGLPVYLHGNSQAAYEFALQATVDTLVHGLWHPHKGVMPKQTQGQLDTIAWQLVQAGIAVQPTIQVLYGEQELLNPALLQDPQLQHAIPLRLNQWYQSEAGQWMSRALAFNFAGPSRTPQQLYQAITEAYQQPLNTVRQMTARLNQLGGRLQFGSDTPSGPFYSQFPGVNGRWEMDRWLESGLSLSQLFSAMTIGNARALGLQQQIGEVKVGFKADLLLLSANPLQDVRAYDAIELVIRNGNVISRAALSATQLQE